MTDRQPDAIRSPLGFAGPGDSLTRLTRLQAEFAPILGTARVYVRHQGPEHFITGGPADTLNFPADGPRCGEPRYDWEDRGDGILFGYLKAHA
jgi:hypothetical protein